MKVFGSMRLREAYRRMLHQSGNPKYVARGIAAGCFIAFFIPFSLQMAIAFLLSIWLRASRIAAVLFTWIANPFTIPIIYPLQCYVGGKIIGMPMDYSTFQHQVAAIIAAPSFHRIGTLGAEIILSFFVGGLLFGSVAAALAYAASLPLVTRYHRSRRLRRQLRKRTSLTYHMEQEPPASS